MEPHRHKEITISEQPLPFFVYGTLRRGEPNYAWALEGKTSHEQQATLSAALMYDNHGGFPYVAHDPATIAASSQVRGEVIHVSERHYPQVLLSLDHLEGFAPGRPNNHYERVQVSVTLDDASVMQAYTYVAGPALLAHLHALPRVTSGDWVAHVASLIR